MKASPHQSYKILEADFNSLWDRLNESGEVYLLTPSGSKFSAQSSIATRGTREQQKLIKINQHGREFARLYSCCWGHTTNCHGARIGGYSDGLNSWYSGVIINLDSLTLKPKNEVIQDFGALLHAPQQSFTQAAENTTEIGGVYLIYDRRQRKYIYADTTDNIRKRLIQQLRRQGERSRFQAQPIQKGLLGSGRCRNSQEACDYITSGCEVRALVLQDEKKRKYPWIRRTLLLNYAVSVLEPDYNVYLSSNHVINVRPQQLPITKLKETPHAG